MSQDFLCDVPVPHVDQLRRHQLRSGIVAAPAVITLQKPGVACCRMEDSHETTCSVGTDRLVRSTPAPDAEAINIFRYMYARFLGEAASITGEPRFAGRGTELTAIGDRSEGVAAAFAEAAKAENPADLLETATEPMHGIADREQDFWERLDAMIAA
jgi:hypothetical protein